MPRAALTLAPLALLSLAGCPPVVMDDTGAGDTGACAEYAAASVNLHVQPVEGLDLATVSARYSVDGGASQACEAIEPGELTCGWEVSGAFVVVVEAPGFQPHEETATVEAGPCHVHPVSFDITLEPEVVAQ